MAVTARKNKARLDFATEIDEVVVPVITEQEEIQEINQTIVENKPEPIEEPEIVQVITEAEQKEVKNNQEQSAETNNTEITQAENDEDELDILLNRLQTGKGVQKSVYIEEDVFNFIQAKCEKTNAKFSNVLNLLARSAIQQQRKK